MYNRYKSGKIVFILVAVFLMCFIQDDATIQAKGSRATQQETKTITTQSVKKKTVKKVAGETKSAPKIKVTFVELGSVGCIPCKMMQPIMKEIEEEYKNQVKVIFYDVRTDLGAPFAQKYKIRVIPTQVFLDEDGNEYSRHEGFFPKDELVKVLKERGVR